MARSILPRPATSHTRYRFRCFSVCPLCSTLRIRNAIISLAIHWGGGQKRKSAALHFFGGHSQSEGHLSGPPNWFHTRPSSGEHTLWRFAILMPPGCCGNCLFRASTSVSISYSTSTWLSKTKFLLTTG